MKPYRVGFLVLFSLPFLAFSQLDEKMEIKAMNRQMIKRKDTVYRFYAIIPEKPIKVRPDRQYYWYKSDTILSTVGGYDGRVLDGSYVVFYPDKNLQEEGLYRNGLRTGEWKSWYPGGKLRLVQHWDEGMKSGSFTEYDFEGRKLREGAFRNDHLSGKIRQYRPNGTDTTFVYKEGLLMEPKEKKKPAVDSASRKNRRAVDSAARRNQPVRGNGN